MQQSELSQSILQQSRETRAALDRVALSTYLPHLDKQRDEVRVSIAVLEQAIPTQQNQKQLANERARLQNLDERIARIERIIEPPPISQPADNSISTAQAWGIAIMIIVIFIIVVAILTK